MGRECFSRGNLPPGVVAMEPSGKCRVQQHLKESTKITYLLAKYKKTGVFDHVQRAKARFGDFTQYQDAAENFDKLAKAQQLFESLPSTLRKDFDNSIPGFFKFIGDPRNFDKCVEYGIFEPRKEEPVPEAPSAPKQPKGGKPPAGEEQGS